MKKKKKHIAIAKNSVKHELCEIESLFKADYN